MASVEDRPKKKKKNHWNRINSSEIDPYIPGNGLLTKVETQSGERDVCSTNRTGAIGYIPVQKMDSCLSHKHK